MGDRANVVVKDGDSQIWFYGHWMGENYVDDARKALARRRRWDDPPYLARIVFDQLTEGVQGEETGFGITTLLTDNENPILVLDCDKQAVYFVAERACEENGRRVPDVEDASRWISFAQFADGGEPRR